MLIVGTGAVASFLCSKIGDSFQVYGSPSDRLSALSRKYHGSGVSSPDQVRRHRLWVVCLKAWQNERKAAELMESPRPEAILVLQNGFDPEAHWQLYDSEVERGLCTYGVKTVRPGVFVGGASGSITLSQNSVFQEPLTKAGMQCRASQDIRTAVWDKLAVNASLNVVATICDCTNGEVLNRRARLDMLLGVCRDVAALARANGIGANGEEYFHLTKQVARETSHNICSTLADHRNGRPTEYSLINGRLLAMAARQGVPVPALRDLDTLFLALARQVA